MNMKKGLRRVLSFIGVWVILFSMLSVSFASAEEFYVIDKANLFSEVELQTLQEKASNLEKLTSAKIMIFVDQTFRGKDAEEFAQKKYEEYKLPDNGVMIVLATEEGQIAAHTEMVDAALDSVMPLLQARRIPEGLINLQDRFIEYFMCDNVTGGVTTEIMPNDVVEASRKNDVEEITSTVAEKVVYEEKPSNTVMYGLCFCLFIGIILLAISNSCRVKKIKTELELEKEQTLSWQSKFKEKDKRHEEEINEWCASAEARTSEIKNLNQKLAESKKKIQKYEEDFEVISILHPNLAAEMEEYYRKKQEEADKESVYLFNNIVYPQAMDGAVTCEKLSQYRTAMKQYNNFTEGQKKWVVGDIDALRENLKVAEQLQKEYEKEQETLRCQKLANSFDYSIRNFNQSMTNLSLDNRHREIKRLMTNYNELPEQAKNLLGATLVQLFNQLYQNISAEWKAEERSKEEERKRREREERECKEREDRERREREERERREREARRRRMNSSSSYGSSSSRSSSSSFGSSRGFKSSSSGSTSSRSFGGGSFGGGKSRGGGAGRSF